MNIPWLCSGTQQGSTCSTLRTYTHQKQWISSRPEWLLKNSAESKHILLRQFLAVTWCLYVQFIHKNLLYNASQLQKTNAVCKTNSAHCGASPPAVLRSHTALAYIITIWKTVEWAPLTGSSDWPTPSLGGLCFSASPISNHLSVKYENLFSTI